MHSTMIKVALVFLITLGFTIAIPTTLIQRQAPEQFDPNDCSINVEGCARAANSDPNRVAICSIADGTTCLKYCNGLSPQPPLGFIPWCQIDQSHPKEPGYCSCTAWTDAEAKEINTALVAIGEATCVVMDMALTITPKVLKLAGTLSRQTELKWAGRLFEIGNVIFAHGSKAGDCKNPACAGHEFVAIDPKKTEEMLGVLNPC